jgi:hypothetical protein
VVPTTLTLYIYIYRVSHKSGIIGLILWCGIGKDCMKGHLFFNEHVNGDVHLRMLNEEAFADVLNEHGRF